MLLSPCCAAAAYKVPRILLTSMDVSLGTMKLQEDMVSFLKLL